ncbi:MAG: helix-turn-helix transcriptional regulator [Acidobacteria bacterium]|nr:helix-turn-helix transcriptional regulator [Acidobacteriota bacterium]
MTLAFDFTKTLENSRYLLNVFQNRGLGVFRKVLWEVTDVILEDARGALPVIDGRFLTIVSGILSVLYVNRSDQIIRKNVLVSQGFLHENDTEAKRDRFVQDLARFLETYLGEAGGREFSERVIFFLKTCSLEELKQVSTETLAERYQLSKNYFADKFRKEQGATLHEAISDEKLNRALLILRNEGRGVSVKNLSWMLGFSDPVYFSRLFRKRFGMSPGEAKAL